MQTHFENEVTAGSILKGPDGKYYGVISFVLDSSVWLTEGADAPEDIDFHSRSKLLTESTIQFQKYELVENGKAGESKNE